MPQHRCFPRARAFREGFPVDESYPVGHVTKRAGLEMRTMEEEAVRGGAGAGQMAPSGGAASFPLWLLLRGGGTAVLLLHTVDLIGIVRTARCSCCSTIARPSALPAWSRFIACEVASAYTGGWSTIAAALECARPHLGEQSVEPQLESQAIGTSPQPCPRS